MILGDPAAASGDVTIENVFRHLARLHPDALALIDPADRAGFTDGEPRRLTFAEADRVVSAIAGRLRSMGLPTDAIVGIQLPNVVENFLTMLGVWRAGMVAAPLPLLWRRADTVMALARIGARALITCGHVGAFDHARLAMQVAAEVFAIRYLCAFGQNLPDGVIPFDDLFAPEADTPLPPPDLDRQNNAAAHVAAVTFDVGQTGPVAVARSHSELLASGLTVLCEARLGQDANILSCSGAGVVRRPEPHAAAVAPERRHAGSAPAVHARHFRHTAARASLRRGDPAGADRPACRRSRRIARATGAVCHRGMAIRRSSLPRAQRGTKQIPL